ncbi:CAP domain-containing protein [bacterium]|nr:CAP domain-containing protein [bacterium]
MDQTRRRAALAICAIALAFAAGCTAAKGRVEYYPDVAENEFDQKTLIRINKYRWSLGLAQLTHEPHLEMLAREHARAMHEAGKMSHDGFRERARRSGMTTCVENLAVGTRTSEQVFNGWRASPGHDRNMRVPDLHYAGVAHHGAYVALLACG